MQQICVVAYTSDIIAPDTKKNNHLLCLNNRCTLTSLRATLPLYPMQLCNCAIGMLVLPIKRRRTERNPVIRARLWREWESTHEVCPLRTLQNNPGRLAVFAAALDSLKRPASSLTPCTNVDDVIFDLAKLDKTLYPIPAGHPLPLGPPQDCVPSDATTCETRHFATTAGSSNGIWCMFCEMWLNGPGQMEDHMIGKKHKKKVRKYSFMLPEPIWA